jgi:hypothetical protein
VESFFSLLQKNVLDSRCGENREELRLAIGTWIETTYNRRRRQRALGTLAPVEFEMIEQPHTRPGTINPRVNQPWGSPLCWLWAGMRIGTWPITSR